MNLSAGQDTLTLLPVGGLGAIGMNCMLLGYGDVFFILDCGVKFAGPMEPGVDLLLPNLEVLDGLGDRLKAIILTHGHEDHIGAVPFVAERYQLPVYGTPFTLGLVAEKFKERGVGEHLTLNTIGPDKPLQLEGFHFDFLRVTHSIPDCVSLAITTPIGRVLFTGDFKIDRDMQGGHAFDREGFEKLGREGVLLMMSDSTNAEVNGWTGSELAVQDDLTQIISNHDGRVLIGLFSSNLYRVAALMAIAKETGRKVLLLGRSLERYTRIGRQKTDLYLDSKAQIGIEDLPAYHDREVLILCTGSQGEIRAALPRIAAGTHPKVPVHPTDLAILSARKIPGNEIGVYQMIDDFCRAGIEVIHRPLDLKIHASGHARRDELSTLLSWVKPRFFLPVHGNRAFMTAHAGLAEAAGVEQTLVVENGAVIQVDNEEMRHVDQLPCAPWMLDANHLGDGRSLAIPERIKLSLVGLISVSVALPAQGSKRQPQVIVQSLGIFNERGDYCQRLQDELMDLVTSRAVSRQRHESLHETIRLFTRRFFRARTGRKPVIIVSLHRAEDT